MDVNYTYDGKLNGNILIVGQAGCGKTTFIQNLSKNKMFRKMKEILWLSKATLSQDREQNISSCFDLKVNFKYPQTLDELNIDFDNMDLWYGPLEIDNFNNAEKQELNEKIEKKKRCEIAEKNKLLKQNKKLDEEKIEEKELWLD